MFKHKLFWNETQNSLFDSLSLGQLNYGRVRSACSAMWHFDPLPFQGWRTDQEINL